MQKIKNPEVEKRYCLWPKMLRNLEMFHNLNLKKKNMLALAFLGGKCGFCFFSGKEPQRMTQIVL